MVFILALISLVLVASATAAYVYNQAKVDVFRPAVIGGVTLMGLYVFDILYAAWDSTLHSSFDLSHRSFVYDRDSLTLAMFLIATSTLGWMVGDIVGAKVIGDGSRTRMARVSVGFNQMGIWLPGFTAFVLAVVAFFLLFQLIQRSGGFDFYWTHIGNRQYFFGDATILVGFLQLATIFGTLSATFMMLQPGRRRKWVFRSVTFWVGVVLLGLVLVLGFLSGARMPLVESLFLLAYIRDTFVQRYKSWVKIAVALTFVVVLSIFYANQTRALTEETTGNPLDRLFNSSEVTHGNNLFIIADEQLGGFAQGETLLSGFTAFVPGAVLDLWGIDKEKGGNTLFTDLIWPGRLTASGSEMVVGILGEFYLNIGLAAVPILATFLGFVYKVAYEMLARARTSRDFWLVLNGGVLWSIFVLLRGDLFHTVISLAVFAFACALLYAFLSMGNSMSAIARRNAQRPALVKTEVRHR